MNMKYVSCIHKYICDNTSLNYFQNKNFHIQICRTSQNTYFMFSNNTHEIGTCDKLMCKILYP